MTDEIDNIIKDEESALSKPVTREDLYKIVWSEPMLKVGAKFKVSSSYMVRVCRRLNVPRPERGYWNKLAVGKALPIPPLPEGRPVDELAWVRDGQNITITRPLPHPPSKVTKRKSRPKALPTDQHPLTKDAKVLFEAGRLSHGAGYLKPNKKLLPDLVVSKTGLDKALTFANQLFLLLEENNHNVIIAPSSALLYRADVDEHEIPRKKRYVYNDLWHPWRVTVVYIGTVAIGLTIIEMSEEAEVRYVNGNYILEKDYIPPKRGRYAHEHTWTTTKDYPTGRLCLQAYSPYQDTQWIKRWQETKGADLNTRIKSIVRELEQAAEEIAKLVEEAAKRAEIRRQEWEAQQEKWQREAEVRRAAEALKESRTELLQIIDKWTKANNIEKFFLDIEREANNKGEDEKLRLLERLKNARKLIGSIDALSHFLMWRSPDER